MTNKEWLDYLAHNAPDELAAWFDSEHVETANGTLDGDTAALNAKIAELTAERDTLQGALDIAVQNESKLEAERDELKFDISLVRKNRDKYRSKFGKCLDYADAIHALMDDEGMA